CRSWSLSQEDIELNAAEKLLRAQVEVIKDNENVASYQLNLRNRGDILSGMQQTIALNQKVGKRLFLSNDLFMLDSRVRELQSDWIRYNGAVEFRSKIFVPGYQLNIDRNKARAIESD